MCTIFIYTLFIYIYILSTLPVFYIGIYRIAYSNNNSNNRTTAANHKPPLLHQTIERCNLWINLLLAFLACILWRYILELQGDLIEDCRSKRSLTSPVAACGWQRKHTVHKHRDLRLKVFHAQLCWVCKSQHLQPLTCGRALDLQLNRHRCPVFLQLIQAALKVWQAYQIIGVNNLLRCSAFLVSKLEEPKFITIWQFRGQVFSNALGLSQSVW